ncbi:putative hydrolase or acyltransferase of alpha/beta superfamily [Beggiatoa alba B18LD]|uniref:Putative hydrolase or acyltransferase of alpha/beta superfamily n=1 Tax=Beggiatoa alba B18LD TaxID=395493 RepID=I3CJC3_9GAMM|nr:alpha/beta hydrolase [Beggiatoa alba]EIJ43716.1 putative hydrolase or acyltransferase of alpha/beta superfamily [Beggiatoa alba B18LD]
MQTKFVTCPHPDGAHRLAYHEWGDIDNPNVLVCVHGLTRNGRDFDDIASQLAEHYRVLCPDVAGRGESEWLPPEHYHYPQYVADMLCLLKTLNIPRVDWLGTSMGGLIGMFVAGIPETPIQRLILNDIGAFIPKEALERIVQYLQIRPTHFDTLDAFETYIRAVHAPFGQLTAQQWRKLTENSACPDTPTGYRFCYDANIIQALHPADKPIEAVELWEYWQKITCPVLIIHGQQSDLLSVETIQKMQEIHPQTEVYTIADAGHAPALMNTEQIQLIQDWLLA